MKPHTALELLDCKYADPLVRQKAVQWLELMKVYFLTSIIFIYVCRQQWYISCPCVYQQDEEMGQYMLQLVQTLKYEPYLDNPLARLLLRRVLLNRKLGHYFFWHVKSELQNNPVFTRFGLILEAYCRGLGPYLKDLVRMVKALDKLTTLTDSIKKDQTLKPTSKERMKFLSDQINQAV